jgi:hypothetical protein
MQFVAIGREARNRMEEASFLRELLDEPVARVAQARFRRDAVLGGGLLGSEGP